MNIDWSNDEQVVKGRWPEAWRHRESGAVWGYAAEYVDPDALDYLGMDWEGARQHPTVQAWEAANRPKAALPEQEGDGDEHNNTHPTLAADSPELPRSVGSGSRDRPHRYPRKRQPRKKVSHE